MSWPTIPLRRLVDCLDGRRVPLNREQRSDMEGAVPYWGAGGILDRIDQHLFNEPLVLLGEDGAPFFIAGKDVAYFVDGQTWVNNHIHVLRPLHVDPSFLRHALNSVDYGKYITGSTRDKLTQDDMMEVELPCPPVSEQRRIADFLDVETSRLGKIATLQARVRSAILSRTIAQVDFRFDALAEMYGTLPFRRMITAIEQGVSPQCDNFAADRGAWGVLKVSAVKNGSFREEENKQLPSEVEPYRRYEIKHRDLLITRANTPNLVGAAAVVESPRSKLMLCDKIFRISAGAGLLPEFLVLVSLSTRIRSMCAEVSHGTSASMANLKTDEIKRWPIPSAPISRQREVVAELSAARDQAATLVDVIDRQLALLAERRQALITAAVTGQIDVTTARGVVT